MTELHARPVVITRPLAQAQPLARRVAEIGRQAVVFPLLEILPLDDDSILQEKIRELGSYAMVAFVSPNAIEAMFRELSGWPPQVAIAVMGEGSKAALARFGLTPSNARILSPIDPQRTDSQTLLEVLDIDVLRGKRILIVRGESGRELLADALRAQGVQVEQVAAYRRAAPVLDEPTRAQLLRLLDEKADWVITSSEALRILIGLAKEAGGEGAVAKLQQQRMIVPHVRIAETASSLGLINVTQTGSGDEQLLAALQSRA